MRIYLAGPLFTEAERDWLRKLKQKIVNYSRKRGIDVEVDWPWEFMTGTEIEQLGDGAGREIFSRCKAKLDTADLLIAWLDGCQVDDGTAWEVGYFYSLYSGRRPIIGFRTDMRNAGELPTSKVNAMIEHSCDQFVRSEEALLSALSNTIPDLIT